MVTFIIGLVILLAGGFFYGGFCQNVFSPDSRKTPAVKFNDDVDYVPMKKWKNSIIELLTIAGMGPILGPIQGILFGPIAFITIPIGCVIGGAFHDYFVGMISNRNEGAQMPKMVKKYIGKGVYSVYNVFVCLMLFLVGVVFLYTPSDIFVGQVLNQGSNDSKNPVFWVVVGIILVYYLLSTLLPIDKIIGKVYPIFSGVVLISTVCVFFGLFIKGYKLDELWNTCQTIIPKDNFLPIFFITVACGMVSGFHSTQSTIVTRSLENEEDGRMTFYNMMICEGIIAMTWAAATMGAINAGIAKVDTAPTAMVGIIAKNMLGPVLGSIAIIGVIILPLTSGNTALKSLKLMVTDALKINTRNKKNQIIFTAVLFVLVSGITVFAKLDSEGFQRLWQYFAWANQVTAVFAFSVITIYMIIHDQPFVMGLIPGTFYMFVITAFILNAKIGFRIPWIPTYIVAGILAAAYAVFIVMHGKKMKEKAIEE